MPIRLFSNRCRFRLTTTASTIVKIPWNDRHRGACEAEVRSARHLHARNDPPEVPHQHHGAGMIRRRPITSTRLRQTNSRIPKSIDSGPLSTKPPRVCGMPALGNGGRSRSADIKAGTSPALCQARHAFAPDQRFRRTAPLPIRFGEIEPRIGTSCLPRTAHTRIVRHIVSPLQCEPVSCGQSGTEPAKSRPRP